MPTSKTLNLPIRVEPGLGEWFKTKMDNPPAIIPLPSVSQLSQGLNVPLISENGNGSNDCGGVLDDGYEPFWKGCRWETPKDVHDRFRIVMEGLVKRVDEMEDESSSNEYSDILFATHAAGVICAVRGLLRAHRAPVVAGVATFVKMTRAECDRGVDPSQWNWIVEINGESRHLQPTGGLKYNWGFPGDYSNEGPFESILVNNRL
ncbi:hypothetical protein HDU76_009691 [Blyttiomyces sp. JEL0837]|nr:hypothetical protein HDU76_009691 [Blyttiomyces sp. JEL0837]